MRYYERNPIIYEYFYNWIIFLPGHIFHVGLIKHINYIPAHCAGGWDRVTKINMSERVPEQVLGNDKDKET